MISIHLKDSLFVHCSFQVLSEFNARRGDGKVYTKEKLLAKFTRKVNRNKRLKVHKDIVTLVTE